ncbi:hypothetical protein [Mesorhizobium sp. SP-1A]|uniref:hypothetical protein n=1 Tax=Mesorhizobium sp. SP-1A TaxID=3077840 RepID=UPI0028F73F39|nr:hypothetical protein [Mesorhizobium sp. SP-1A]
MLHSTSAAFRGFTRPVLPGRKPIAASPEVVTDWAWFEEFLAERGETGQKQYQDWEKRRGKLSNWAELMAGFRALEHKVLYRLEIVDIKNAIRQTTHALGTIDKSAAKFDDIHNYSPPVPLVYIFHSILEKMGRVPVWNDIKRHLFGDFRSLCWVPFCNSRKLNAELPVNQQDTRIMDAFLWRMGNAYYSWLREVDLLTYLRRTEKLDLKYHFLVDAEWRADFVAGRILLELYVKNREFKDDDGGRKLTCARMNADYEVLPIKLDTAPDKEGPKFGKPWMVSDECKLMIARELRSRGCPRIA